MPKQLFMSGNLKVIWTPEDYWELKRAASECKDVELEEPVDPFDVDDDYDLGWNDPR